MDVRTVFSGVLVTGLTLALVPLGCGGAQEEPAMVARPSETGALHALQNQRDGFEPPEATRQALKGCIKLRAGQWSERSYAVLMDAKATDHGDMSEVSIRGTTIRDDDVVECLRQSIAAMTIPEQELRRRSSRPFSGGERMTREQRGLIGSDSQNPVAWALVLVVEEVGVDVLIEVSVGIIAAVATLVMPKKTPPDDECLDKYVACMDSRLADLVVDKRGTSLCHTCRLRCDNDGGWPSAVKVTQRWHSCR